MSVVAFRFRSRSEKQSAEKSLDDPADDSLPVNVSTDAADAAAGDGDAADVDSSDVSAGDAAAGDLVFDDDEDGEWLAIELHEWALETRSMLARLLLADGVVHSWQGTTLLAHESLEEIVDALIDEAARAEARGLDPDRPQMAFEMTGWSGGLQARLSERLGSAGVPHEFDSDGDLVCHEDDEEHVELLIEDIIAREGDSGLTELDGLEANNLLSAMFEATDRLRRDVHDSKGVLGVVEHGGRLAGAATPFGFSATGWGALREAADQLVELIESEDSSDVEIRDLAIRLRDTLQRLV